MAAADMLRLQHVTTTTIATATTTAILAGIGGYLLGQARSFGSSGTLFGRGRRTGSKRDRSSSDEEEDEPMGLNDSKLNANEEYKLVLVVRTDLGMSRGSCVS